MTLGSEPVNRTPAHRWLSRLLMAFGLACLAAYAFSTVRTSLYQREAKAQLERSIVAEPESPTMTRPAAVASTAGALARGSVIGRVDVPRLHLSAAIAEGDDDSTLD